MAIRDDIIQNYNDLCDALGEQVGRDKYRKYGNYKTSLIDKVFGSWKDFQKEVNRQINFGRGLQTISKKVLSERALVTSVVDGTEINEEFWITLKNYAEYKGCDLYVLWGKPIKKGKYFQECVFDELKRYLVTDLSFELDDRCAAKDLFIPYNQKNPLNNLDKLSNKLTTIIVGSTKQYMKTLPYDYNDSYKIAWSTGTISNIDYDQTISGSLDSQNHTFGALYLEYNKSAGRYNVRNLIYKDNCMIDLDREYTVDGAKSLDTIPAMVMGDLHLPEEDEKSISYAVNIINTLKIKNVILHDIFSMNSISHHNFNQALTRYLNRTEENETLEKEMIIASKKLDAFTSFCPDANFTIIHSNHDDFITKYLNTCDFIHDTNNVVTAMELFIDIVKGRNPLGKYITSENIEFLEPGSSLEICGFELGQHGSSGIAGARGSALSYSKTYTKSISGHTHSPATFETSVVVGTNSKIRLSYNKEGICNWAHDNVLIHKNGTYQHLFWD